MRQGDDARLQYDARHRQLSKAKATWSFRLIKTKKVSIFEFFLLDGEDEKMSFAQLLQRSICREQVTQAWCDQCGKYKPHVSDRCI